MGIKQETEKLSSSKSQIGKKKGKNGWKGFKIKMDFCIDCVELILIVSFESHFYSKAKINLVSSIDQPDLPIQIYAFDLIQD